MDVVECGNIRVELPSSAKVSYGEGGRMQLTLTNFTGTITLVPPTTAAKRVASGDSEESASFGGKRLRHETPVDGSEASASVDAAADASATRTAPGNNTHFFRNGGGGPSQDSDDEEEEAPAAGPARNLVWDELMDTTAEPGGRSSASGAAAATTADSEMAKPSAQPPPYEGPTQAAAATAAEDEAGEAGEAGEVAAAAADDDDDDVDAPQATQAPLVPVASDVAAALLATPPEATPPAADADADAGSAAMAAPDAEAVAGGGCAAFPFARDASLDEWEWVRLSPSGDAPTARWGHAAVATGGAMFLLGGDDLTDSDDDILKDLYKLDLESHEWSRCRDAPHGRCWHSATVVGGSVSGNSNVILVFGGETLKPGATGVRQPLSTMLSYDPEFDIFYDAVDRGHRPSARLGHTASVHTANAGSSSPLSSHSRPLPSLLIHRCTRPMPEAPRQRRRRRSCSSSADGTACASTRRRHAARRAIGLPRMPPMAIGAPSERHPSAAECR